MLLQLLDGLACDRRRCVCSVHGGGERGRLNVATTSNALDTGELEARVKAMYREVAEEPDKEFHFETGRALAERLGYPPRELDDVPSEAIESFAGVGYYFDLAAIEEGEIVIDLGSGSGMDSFLAARLVGLGGRVIGIDMTDAQLAKARRLGSEGGFGQVEFHEGYIERLPVDDAAADVVISNGVINLAPDKTTLFQEAARVLRPGGRLAIADIVTTAQLPDTVTCDASLWAACIGGASQQDDYRAAIERAGLRTEAVRDNNEYRFVSERADRATKKYGVRSISLLARKPR
jgi:ubiquinone/menaquinone biosynthesis C-methylase UbiE